ncbi:hypothetical protein FOA43_002131 [Brettanomyces nanus]|uniref:Uncharacterized protein n=1 Tax=Eeniella nana TaxID=13502 RepID=A0A875S057_EENNA|nr:uncharacterized protein FOA43_002131 [Brettanomyces nanus]QPG74796.1 hypothetical protein FOA43_002131 [Brettanomyces nanus]
MFCNISRGIARSLSGVGRKGGVPRSICGGRFYHTQQQQGKFSRYGLMVAGISLVGATGVSIVKYQEAARTTEEAKDMDEETVKMVKEGAAKAKEAAAEAKKAEAESEAENETDTGEGSEGGQTSL